MNWPTYHRCNSFTCEGRHVRLQSVSFLSCFCWIVWSIYMLLELLKWWLKSWNWWTEIVFNFIFNLKIFHSVMKVRLSIVCIIDCNDAFLLVFIIFRWSALHCFNVSQIVFQLLGVQWGGQTNLDLSIVFTLLAAKKNTIVMSFG